MPSEAGNPKPSPPRIDQSVERTMDRVDEAGIDSFPASDPPAWTSMHAGARNENGERIGEAHFLPDASERSADSIITNSPTLSSVRTPLS